MADLCTLCFEVIHLLSENTEPRIEFDVNFDSCANGNVNEHGMLCVLKFLETLKDSRCQIQPDGDELHDKLVELADSIVMADFGEVSAFQNYLYDRVITISELLIQPRERNEGVRVDDILQHATVPTTTSKRRSYLDGCDKNKCVPPLNPLERAESIRDEDPIYAEILELVESAAERKSKKCNISAKIDSIIRYFLLRSPHRCRNAFANRMADIKEAVNFVSRGENAVSYTSFLKFQADEIYMMLQKDVFYDDDHSMLAEMKIAWAILADKVRDYFADDSGAEDGDRKFKSLPNFCSRLFVAFCTNFVKCNRTTGITFIILNFLILGFCIIL